MQRLTRRHFLEAGAVSVGAATLSTTARSVMANAAARGGRSSVTRNALHLPPSAAAQSTLTAAVAVTLRNLLADATTIHWHGLVVRTDADGQPQDPVVAGASNTYSFTLDQRASFNFYHPHPHMKTGSQVYHGLAVPSWYATTRGPRSACRAAPTRCRWCSVTPASTRVATSPTAGRPRAFSGRCPRSTARCRPIWP